MAKYIIGIDEVGRGALAGPVAVAAALVKKNWLRGACRPKGELHDSKKLSPNAREEWSKWLCSHPRVDYSIARVYPRQIEKRNISAAANLAAHRAYGRLIAKQKSRIGKHKVFLDGGLFLGNGDQPKNARTIVRGDEKIKAVAAASIIAKVSRDRFMEGLAGKYPQYGFEIHKGYGTKAHREAIKKHGPSAAHRLTFLGKYAKI